MTVWWAPGPEWALFIPTQPDDAKAEAEWVLARPRAIRIIDPPRKIVECLLLNRMYALESPDGKDENHSRPR